MTLAETGGVAITIGEYAIALFDSNKNFISTVRKTAGDFASTFSACGAGSTRIAANSQVCGSICLNLEGRRSGFAVFTFVGKGDGDAVSSCFDKSIILRGQNQDADLSVSIVNSTTDIVTGKRVLYTIKVTNNGSKTASGVRLNTSVPVGATFSSIAVSEGTSTTPPSGGIGAITCLLDSIGPESAVIVSLVLNVTAPANSTITITVNVTSTSTDTNLTDNSASSSVFVINPLPPSTPGLLRFDLSLDTTNPPETPASGTRFTYTATLKNAGPDNGAGIFFVPLPAGTTFASITTSDQSGNCRTPSIGSGGAVLCGSNLLSVNGTFGVSVTVNVLTSPGSVLSNKADLIEGSTTERSLFSPLFCVLPIFVTIPTEELNSNNDVGATTKQVQGGRIVNLFWQQPAAAPTSADAARNAMPILTRVSPATVAQEAEASVESITLEDDNGCTLIRVNIYKSDQPNVQPSPANLWRSVAPDKLQATMAAAPAGSFFRVANVWICGNSGSGGGSIESGRSNEVNSAGAQIPFIIGTPAKQGKALIVTGENFNSGAKLLINGVQQKTSVEASTRLFCKKAGKKVRSGDRLQVRNSDGGLSPEVTFP
jgi:uncharacterized repeat protein (TIGR01451 family)